MATTINYADKEQGQVSTYPSNQTWSFGDANAIKDAINSHAADIEAVESELAAINSSTNTIVVNQLNVAATLGGIIDSTKRYFIDGVIDMTGVTCEVPNTGITLGGSSATISKLICADNSYTMFTSPVGGSGDFIHDKLTISVTGTSSKVYQLKSEAGISLIGSTDIIWLNCTSRGSIDNYAQGTESNTLRIGGAPQLEFIGVWSRGYRVTTSQSFALSNTAHSIYKAGAGLTFGGRFRTDENIDLSALASVTDFAPANFINPSSLQFIDCLISRNGVVDPTDTNLHPNITNADLASFWDENVGFCNTHVGGRLTLTTEVETTLLAVDTYATVLGTWTPADLEHYDSPLNGQLRNLGNSPREMSVVVNLIFDGQANDEYVVKCRKWDNSAAVFDELEYTAQPRVINNLQGGRDVAYFMIINNVELDQNDYLYIEAKNITSSDNFTVELGSYILVHER